MSKNRTERLAQTEFVSTLGATDEIVDHVPEVPTPISITETRELGLGFGTISWTDLRDVATSADNAFLTELGKPCNQDRSISGFRVTLTLEAIL